MFGLSYFSCFLLYDEKLFLNYAFWFLSQVLVENIKSDDIPISTFAYGDAITNEPSLSSDQKSKIKSQIAEIKKEIEKLSDRAGDAKHRFVNCLHSTLGQFALFWANLQLPPSFLRYKRAIDKLEAEKKQKLVDLNKTYQELDKQINVLKQKDDKIGKVEGDPVEVRAKETQIEVQRYSIFRHAYFTVSPL